MEKIKIAKIINTHALKGELKLELYTDFGFERFKKGQELFVENELLEVSSYREYRGFGYVKFNSFDDINKVLKFKNKYIFINRNDIKDLEDGYYFFQLKGLEVFNNNEMIGTIIEIEEGIAHHNLRIKLKDNEKTILVPYIDNFVKEINLDEKKIILSLIEGFL